FLNNVEFKQALPSDELELNRLLTIHALVRFKNGNFSAPVEEILMNNNAKVLDVGCGPGCWIIDLATDFPKSTFIGIDIVSGNFPPVNKRPSNAGFLECNVLNGIPFPNETFDYVHMSIMWSAFTRKQYINTIHELVRVTKHDGWIEIQESDLELVNLGDSMKFLQSTVHAKLREDGFDPKIVFEIPKCLESIDEVSNFEHYEIKASLGKWSGNLGEYALELLKQYYGALTYMPDYMKISHQEYQKLFEKFDNE
ncbi:2338_t:CDS:2, partial [Scutellospora calospora]